MEQGEVLKKLRTERGFSQEKLTEGICARSTLATFENKGSYLSVELCSKFLDRLNIRADMYFNLISEDFDSKRTGFDRLKNLIDKDDNDNIVDQKNYFHSKYTATKDIYWFHLYFLAVEHLESLNNEFSYENFKIDYVKEIDVLKSYLYKVANWGSFEFALFSNSLWYFELDLILTINKKIKKSFSVANQSSQTLYGKHLLNFGFYCLEFGHHQLIDEIKNTLFAMAGYDNIHWKILSTYQLALSQELLTGKKSENDRFEIIIEPYYLFKEEHYAEELKKYRNRMHTKFL
ncbi:helix-turn-helix domain-containing protein [Alkalibacterium pelagium]|uniref:HTH cro/C1-type domain-containing protein n=1 Tax=Alkalibacterium pelagium TaxID=426702 RepID=A0A1H7JE97_9LACT|nr:helix-turn-helix transcriptional regulator [Alkalibacterium pelagium]GEN50173.1 hypothetical protein APE02nite_08380 [Alkalibacterium pelagium]SEK72772.1 hypothetical protein SAMN04488099_105152 [Alkalibacterium pelagium]